MDDKSKYIKGPELTPGEALNLRAKRIPVIRIFYNGTECTYTENDVMDVSSADNTAFYRAIPREGMTAEDAEWCLREGYCIGVAGSQDKYKLKDGVLMRWESARREWILSAYQSIWGRVNAQLIKNTLCIVPDPSEPKSEPKPEPEPKWMTAGEAMEWLGGEKSRAVICHEDIEIYIPEDEGNGFLCTFKEDWGNPWAFTLTTLDLDSKYRPWTPDELEDK